MSKQKREGETEVKVLGTRCETIKLKPFVYELYKSIHVVNINRIPRQKTIRFETFYEGLVFEERRKVWYPILTSCDDVNSFIQHRQASWLQVLLVTGEAEKRIYQKFIKIYGYGGLGN